MQGLGDAVELVTKATGIEKVVKFVAGEDCGCDTRREKLNAIFRFRAPLCMNEEEFKWWTDFKASNPVQINHEQSEQIARIYMRLFQRAKLYRPCTCNPREWQRMIDEINKVFNTYE